MADTGFDFTSVAKVRDLIDRALSGCSKSAAILVRGIAPIIQVHVARALSKRRAQSMGRDPRQDLEDMVQETFAALFASRGRALRSWDPARGRSFLSFVGFLAEREVAQRMRAKRRNPWTEEPTDRHDLAGSIESDERRLESRDLLRRILAGLGERTSPLGLSYFRMLYLEEQPIADVATATGASRDALYAWRSRLCKLACEVRAELAALR